MLVTIVAVPNADITGIHLDRVEKVENLPAEVARRMVDLGTARLPSEEELEAYREAKIAEVDRQVAEAETEPADADNSGPDADGTVTPTPATTTRTSKKTAASAEPPTAATSGDTSTA